jgi:NADH:ubiquinone oxidoreductase subunit B-like Fe-S oxidoreductase
VVTLNLTIGYTESSTVTITDCAPFVWDGVAYDSTGMYTNVYSNISGCDSTVTLDLTITGVSSSSTVTITSCDSFDWDGMTYDSTGMYTNIYTGLNGCDSTVTLDLTINNSSSSTVTITACDSFDWDGMTYDSTGTYTNLYTDINGCDSTVTLDLTINDGPNDATVIQNGDSLTVTVSNGTAPYTYEWNTGETTQSILPDSSGTYYCIVTDANGCEDSSNQYVYTSTSISELNSNKMLVYPNPTEGILNIEFNNFDNRFTSLSIVNILGDEIYEEELDNTIIKYSKKLDLSKYSHGIYFVKFSSIEEVLTKKLILQ